MGPVWFQWNDKNPADAEVRVSCGVVKSDLEALIKVGVVKVYSASKELEKQMPLLFHYVCAAFSLVSRRPEESGFLPDRIKSREDEKRENPLANG